MTYYYAPTYMGIIVKTDTYILNKVILKP